MPAPKTKPTESKLRVIFAQNVRDARIKRELSQRELAARAGCSNKQLSHVEQGRHWPSLPVYLGLCRELEQKTPPMFARVEA
jgi:transcriptional regulator with XRE-family HTH domain